MHCAIFQRVRQSHNGILLNIVNVVRDRAVPGIAWLTTVVLGPKWALNGCERLNLARNSEGWPVGRSANGAIEMRRPGPD